MAKWPNFVNGSYRDQAFLADQEDTINFYVERMESPGAQNAMALLPTPGFSQVAMVPTLGSRGAIFADGRMFQVIGGVLYEFYVDGTYDTRGTVGQDSNLATLSYNGLAGGQLFITSNTNGFNYDLSTNTLTQVLTSAATMGAFANGYFLAFNIVDGKVRLSALQDGTSWDPNDYFQRSFFADPWQAMFVDSQAFIWLVGTETYEVWYNTGASPIPFQPLSGLVGKFGIVSPFGWAVAGSRIVWLSSNENGAGTLIDPRSDGGTPLTTYPIASQFATYARTAGIGNAEIMAYQQDGHTFFNIAFPSSAATWTYDADAPIGSGETGRLPGSAPWARRGRWNPSLNRYDLWTPRTHVYAFGKHLIGDRTTGVLAEMTTSVSTELDGAGVRRVRQAPAITNEHQRFSIDQIELLMDVGLGDAPPAVAPIVTLEMADYGGRVFGNARQCSAGWVGQYRTRVYWTRCGQYSNPVARVTMSDPYPWRITDAWVNNLEQGRAA